jgi:diguanylate cyclase (GGDEF)-like protein/PAS domain S-box-containing protein
MYSPPSANDLLAVFLSAAEEAVVGFHLDGTVFLWNSAAETLYGHAAGEIVGRPVDCIFPIYELPALKESLRNPEQLSSFRNLPSERLSKAGFLFHLRVSRSPVCSPEGQIVGILERARAFVPGLTGASADIHLQFLVEKLPFFFWTTDRQLRIASHWGNQVRRGNRAPINPVGQSVQQYLRSSEASESPLKQHFLALRGIASRFEYTNRRNRVYDMSIEPYRGPQGAIVGCIGMALDITERKKTEEEIRHRATHDGLTGLANYREFFDSVEHESRRAGRSGQSFAVLLLDLDDLKTINDRLGHLAGNQALKRLASVMKGHCRATEIAARFGGDEFAILLLDADGERARNVAERIRSCLRLQNEKPPLSVSIGLAVYPLDGSTATDLLEAADKRLYQDKKSRHVRETQADQEPSEAL